MMKMISKAVSGLLMVSSLLFLTACPGSENATDPMKVQLGKLSKTWTMVTPTGGALFDGTDDRTAAFPGFTLTISGTYDKNSPEGAYSYAVGGTQQIPEPWPVSGSWTFNSVDKGSDSGTLVRDDGVPMTYNIQSDGKLVVIFDCTACGNARTKTVNGNWKFTFQ